MTLPRHLRHGGDHAPMEANEVQELKEHAEHAAGDSGLRPVAFTMSLLAVLVAVTTVLGHRTHTEAVLMQNKATDQWNEYQAKKIRSNNTALISDLLSVVTIADKDAANKIVEIVCRSSNQVGRRPQDIHGGSNRAGGRSTSTLRSAPIDTISLKHCSRSASSSPRSRSSRETAGTGISAWCSQFSVLLRPSRCCC